METTENPIKKVKPARHRAETPAETKTGKVQIKSVALLTNPNSGKGGAVEKTKIALKRFAELGIKVHLLKGNSREESIELARKVVQKRSHDALVVCGGDGLIANALQSQAGSSFPLGIIPAGTGNDHARHYHIPLDPVEAVDVIAKGNTICTDLGVVHGKARGVEGHHWFGTIACCGFDSLVSERTNQMKWPKGKVRYKVATVIELLTMRPHNATITIDGKAHRRKLMMITIGNTETYAGGRPVCIGASSDDGKFNITVTSVKNRFRNMLLIDKITRGKFENIAEVEVFVTDKFDLEFDGASIYADGDYLADPPATIECVPNAGRYIVP